MVLGISQATFQGDALPAVGRWAVCDLEPVVPEPERRASGYLFAPDGAIAIRSLRSYAGQTPHDCSIVIPA